VKFYLFPQHELPGVEDPCDGVENFIPDGGLLLFRSTKGTVIWISAFTL
jgi:hypothetical protein